MTVYSVTFDGTRFSVVDSYTNWGNYGGSGAGGAAESPIAYQNALAANRKQSTTGGSLGGIDYDPAAGAIDHTGATRRLYFCKVIISDSFDCNTSEGLRVTVGSASTATFKYNLAGSTATNDAYLAYPPQGGYILTAIDVTESFWPITTTGTFDDTAVDYYGVQGSWITGQAKAENIAMDAIDVGTGLYLVGGTGADPEANFTSYVEKDQDISTNRWGCVSGAGANVAAWCVLRAGGAIEFLDTTSVVSFKDGYHTAGLTGVLHELDTAASTFTMGALLIGEGKLYNSGAIDTRPDYTVTGTTMTAAYNLTGTLRNFRNVVLNSKVDANGADIECQLLTQATAEIQNSIIRCNALTSVAVLQDPTFGTTTGLHDTEFIQNGVGHAIEIDTAGDYDFTNLVFTDGTAAWGANTTDNAMIDVTVASGTVNISVVGGTAAVTYKAAGTTTVNIIAAVTVTVNGATEGSSVKIISRETLGAVTVGDTLSTGFVPNSGVYTYSHNDEGSLDVTIRVRNQGIATAAISDDGTVFTDETSEASSNSTADMTLLPTTPVIEDAYYFGHDEQFPRMKIIVSTAMVHSAAVLAVEYYNGATWSAVDRGSLSPANDFYDTTGEKIIDWLMPSNWATTTINSQGPFYYVRIRLVSFTTITTAPIGSNASLDVTRYLPYDADREILTGSGLADFAAWQKDTVSQLSPLPLPVAAAGGGATVLDVLVSGSESASGTATTTSDTIALVAGTTRKLIVWYATEAFSSTPFSATYDGNAMTFIGSVSDYVGGDIEMHVFYYDVSDGDSGSKTIQAATVSTRGQRNLCWALIDNAATGAEDAAQTVEANFSSVNYVDTPSADDAILIHGIWIKGGSGFGAGTGDTIELSNAGSTGQVMVVSELAPTAVSTTITSDWTGFNQYARGGVTILHS